MAEFVMISGCRDNQESDDSTKGASGGAFTTELLKVLNQTRTIYYQALLNLVRDALKRKHHVQVPQMTSSFLIKPTDYMKIPKLFDRKYALLVGINYIGDKDGGELFGCHTDVKNTKKFLIEKLGYVENDIVILMDDGIEILPTRSNIEDEIENLCNSASRGDFVWIHVSSHGRSIADTSGDETDLHDETIEPLDFNESGQMRDDDLNRILVEKMPAGVYVTVIIDTCHSGTVLDLKYKVA